MMIMFRFFVSGEYVYLFDKLIVMFYFQENKNRMF